MNVLMVMASLLRKAYISRLIYDAYHNKKTKLKKHGANDKIDFCTCTWFQGCLCGPYSILKFFLICDNIK